MEWRRGPTQARVTPRKRDEPSR